MHAINLRVGVESDQVWCQLATPSHWLENSLTEHYRLSDWMKPFVSHLQLDGQALSKSSGTTYHKSLQKKHRFTTTKIHKFISPTIQQHRSTSCIKPHKLKNQKQEKAI